MTRRHPGQQRPLSRSPWRPHLKRRMWLPTRAGAGDAAQASVLRCGVRVQFVLATVTVTCVSRGATGTSTCSTFTGDEESTDAITTTRFVKSRGSTTYAPPRTRLLALSESGGRASASRRQRRACVHRYVALGLFSRIVVLTEWWSAGSPARSSEASVSGSRAKSTGGGLDASTVRPPTLEATRGRPHVSAIAPPPLRHLLAFQGVSPDGGEFPYDV